MENKCSKYEGLFVFADKEVFDAHIKECEDCKKEHEKMEKVSNLLGEVKSHYLIRAKRLRKLKAVCALAFFMFFSASFSFVSNDTDLVDVLMYGDSLSAEDLGFPVDSYGLLLVDD